MRQLYVYPVAICLFWTMITKAQLSQELKEQTLTALSDSISKYYILEEKAQKLSSLLVNEETKADLYRLVTAEAFTSAVNQLMFSMVKDHHLNLYYSAEPLEEAFGKEGSGAEWDRKTIEFLVAEHYGIPEVKILPGNIGYIETSLFGPLEYCAEVIIHAMREVEDTDALIIDLRKNGGSMDPNTIPFLSGYFFDTPVHLINFENRAANTVRQMWSAAWVPGKKYLEKPVYILTSYQTFSGAEEFAFDFKMLGRAVIIGDTTKGGANPIETVKLNEHFHVSMPKEQALNPVTNTNWEQRGVSPDIKVNAADALEFTQIKILRNLLARSPGKSERADLEQAISNLENKATEKFPVSFRLDGYPDAQKVAVVGSFNYWKPNADFLVWNGKAWTTELKLRPGMVEYKFVVDGKWVVDPENPEKIQKNGQINSVLSVDKKHS